MRIMAIDYGDARTGVAVSDPTGSIAGDAWVVSEKNPRRLAEIIAQEVHNRGVSRVVLGYPRNMNGTAGPRAAAAEAFAALLRELGLDVTLWDERLTTVAAHNILSEHNKRGKKRRETVDAVAATLILEGFLASDKRN